MKHTMQASASSKIAITPGALIKKMEKNATTPSRKKMRAPRRIFKTSRGSSHSSSFHEPASAEVEEGPIKGLLIEETPLYETFDHQNMANRRSPIRNYENL